jgi:hypothetical protein
MDVMVVENGEERFAFSIEDDAHMSMRDVYERLGFDVGAKHVVFRMRKGSTAYALDPGAVLANSQTFVGVTGPACGADIHTDTPPPYQT